MGVISDEWDDLAKSYGVSLPSINKSAPKSKSSTGWWTPDRVNQAVNHLQEHANLSPLGAHGLVSRWAGVEAQGGPSSVNSKSGAFGIGQWLGSRKNGVPADFEGQLNHAVKELNATESAAAKRLRSARTPEDAAIGASMYERAEGYDPKTGRDKFVDSTIQTMNRLGAPSAYKPVDFDALAADYHDTGPNFDALAQDYHLPTDTSNTPLSSSGKPMMRPEDVQPPGVPPEQPVPQVAQQPQTPSKAPNIAETGTTPSILAALPPEALHQAIQGTPPALDEGQIEAQKEQARQDAISKQKTQAIQQVLKPQPKVTQYDFQKNGKLTLPAAMGETGPQDLTYEKDPSIEKNGEYRLKGADGNPYIYSPTTGKIVDEYDTSVLKEIPVQKPEMNSVSPETARRVVGEQIADAIASDYPRIPKKDIVDYFAQSGLSHWDTKQQLSEDQYFQPKGFTNPTTGLQENAPPENYHLTQRDVNRIEAFSQDRQQQQGKYQDAFKTAKMEGNDDFSADLYAKADAGMISQKDVGDILAQKRQMRQEAADALKAENQGNLSMGSGKANLVDPGKPYEPSGAEIDAKLKEMTAPENIAASQRIQKDAGEIANNIKSWGLPGQALAGITAATGGAKVAVAGALRPFQWIPGVGDVYKALSEKGQAQLLAQDLAKDDSWAGWALSHGTKVIGDLTVLAALNQIPGVRGRTPTLFAVQGGLSAAGAGKPVSEVTKSTFGGYLIGKVFDGATAIEGITQKAVANKGFANQFEKGFWDDLSQYEKDAVMKTFKESAAPITDSAKRVLMLSTVLSKVAGGTVLVGGTAGVAQAEGSNKSQTIDQIATNLLFHFGGQAAGTLADGIGKVAGRISRIWKDGKPNDYFLDDKEQVQRTVEPVPQALVENETVLDPENPVYKNQQERRASASVPETGDQQEGQQYTSQIDEIQQKGADTKAKIKEIFPQLSNEEAADLRRQAFPEGQIASSAHVEQNPELSPEQEGFAARINKLYNEDRVTDGEYQNLIRLALNDNSASADIENAIADRERNTANIRAIEKPVEPAKPQVAGKEVPEPAPAEPAVGEGGKGVTADATTYTFRGRDITQTEAQNILRQLYQQKPKELFAGGRKVVRSEIADLEQQLGTKGVRIATKEGADVVPPTKVGAATGARRATVEGAARTEDARQQLANVINNPDLVGKQRADTIANLRNLVQFQQANANRPLETDYHAGDQIAYTGDNAPEGFANFIYLEGHKAGEYGDKILADVKNADVAQRQKEWTDQQAAFKRVREAAQSAETRAASIDSGAAAVPSRVSAYDDIPKDDKNIWWHGSPSGDLRGGTSGLHIGTHKAATQALEATIGIPAEGEWDGTRKYGDTLLAGQKTQQERGIGGTGYNAFNLPEEDFYAKDRTEKATYSNGHEIPLDATPSIEPVKLTGKMTNRMDAPHEDFKANGYMRGALKKDNAKRGYFYKNISEDEGSISAVVPNASHLERVRPPQHVIDAEARAASIDSGMLPATPTEPSIEHKQPSPDFKDWFKDSAVVDKNGEPLTVYHGTNKRFETFEPRKTYRNIDGKPTEVEPSVYFFSTDKDTARTFAKDKVLIAKNLKGEKGGRAEVRPFHLSIQKPLDLVIDHGSVQELADAGFAPYFNRDAPHPLRTGVFEEIGAGQPEDWNDVQMALDDPHVINELQSKGYDGVRLRENDGSISYAVFDPEQIKSTKVSAELRAKQIDSGETKVEPKDVIKTAQELVQQHNEELTTPKPSASSVDTVGRETPQSSSNESSTGNTANVDAAQQEPSANAATESTPAAGRAAARPESALTVPKGYGKQNTLVTADEALPLQDHLLKKFGGERTGFGSLALDDLSKKDIEAFTKVALFHIEAGARSLKDFGIKMKDAGFDLAQDVIDHLYGLVRDTHGDKKEFAGMDEPPKGIHIDLKEKGTKERSLPKTFEAAQMDKGTNLTYEPEKIATGIELGRAKIAEKGLDGAIEYVKHNNGIDWAPTGYAVLEHMRNETIRLKPTDPETAAKMQEKRINFLDDFAEEATKRGQAIVGIKAIEEFAPDRAAYLLNKASQRARNRPITAREDARITDLGKELERERNRAKGLEDQLTEANKRAGTKSGKKAPSYLDALEKAGNDAKASIVARLGKLDLQGLKTAKTFEGQKGAVGESKELPGDAELLAKYTAGQLHKIKTVEDLNKHLIETFGKEIESHLPDIRQRAYQIRQDARIAALEAKDAPKTQGRTILQDIRSELADVNKEHLAKTKELARSTDPITRIAAKNELKALAEAKKAKQAELIKARQAEQKGYRASIAAKRQVEKEAAFWDTPMRDLADKAIERLKTADPTTPDVMNDLASVGAVKFLRDMKGGVPGKRAISPSQFYREMQAEHPNLVTKKNQGEIYKQSYQRVQDAVAAGRNAAALNRASEVAQSVWSEQGVDTNAQAILIQQATNARRQYELRSAMANEFNRVSQSTFQRIGKEILNTPRALMTSLNMHQGRQGLFTLLTHPIKVSMRISIPATLKGFMATPEEFLKLTQEMKDSPGYPLAEKSNVNFAELPRASTDLKGHIEEDILQSTFAQKLPWVRRSTQGFILGMNAERLGLFNYWASIGEANGYTFENNPKFFTDAGSVANDFTGRGIAPEAIEKVIKKTNQLFFAPRLKVSQVKAINDLFDPFKYFGKNAYDPVMRKIMAKEALRTVAGASVAYATLIALGGKSTDDPDDPDFFKVRFGHTHYDLTGGAGATFKFAYKFFRSVGGYLAGEKQSEYDKPLSVASSFARKKLAPWPGAAIDFFTGKNAVGQPSNLQFSTDVPKTMRENIALKMILPLIVNEITEGVADDGWKGLAKTAPASLFGVTEQTYEPSVFRAQQQLKASKTEEDKQAAATDLRNAQKQAFEKKRQNNLQKRQKVN